MHPTSIFDTLCRLQLLARSVDSCFPTGLRFIGPFSGLLAVWIKSFPFVSFD